jgi:hypothetical protein
MHPSHMVSSASTSHYQIPSQLHHNQAICNCNVHSSSYSSSNPNQNQMHPSPQPSTSGSFYTSPSNYNHFCSVHSSEYVPPPPPAPTQTPPNSNFYHLQQNMPHSKSLDQYDAGGKQPQPNGNILHRLSLDHNYNDNFSKLNHQQHLSPVATGPFDCIDTIAFNHPYNQPNVRSPLPYNLISNNPLGQVQVAPQQQQFYPPEWGYYHQLHQQLPTPVNDYKTFTDFTDSSSPAMPDSELISFNDIPQSSKLEGKLRSSLKKSALEQNHELEYLRSLKKREHMSCSDTSSRTHDDVIAELDSMNISSNGHGPPKGHNSSAKSNGVAGSSTSSAKLRTKSVSTTTELGSDHHHHHEHKRTSSMLESTSSNRSNSDKYKPPQQPQIIVPPGEWSCRFCTFLNPNAKKICEMCSKSKDFFLDADKTTSSATATCV